MNEDTPQRGPRTRDNRAKDRRDTKALLDAYLNGDTED